MADLEAGAPWPKVCFCGASWTFAEWRNLRYVGIMDLGDGEPLELRTCTCLSTLAVAVEHAGSGQR